MSLSIKQRSSSEVMILDLSGRLWILDLQLRDTMNDLLGMGQCYFVLNLSGVDYIDSSGLGQLISIWSSIRNKNGYMTILKPNKRVQRLFEITRLNTIFEVLDDEATAVRKAHRVSA